MVGLVHTGWLREADFAITTRRGSGLATALTLATNRLIDDGRYARAVARWRLHTEAFARAQANPARVAENLTMCAMRQLAFPTPGNYDDEEPAPRLDAVLRLFELGERLGFDGARMRRRNLERGVSSAAAFLAAALQRTRDMGVGAVSFAASSRVPGPALCWCAA